MATDSTQQQVEIMLLVILTPNMLNDVVQAGSIVRGTQLISSTRNPNWQNQNPSLGGRDDATQLGNGRDSGFLSSCIVETRHESGPSLEPRGALGARMRALSCPVADRKEHQPSVCRGAARGPVKPSNNRLRSLSLCTCQYRSVVRQWMLLIYKK
ncbi:hypothetical protein ACJJTC_009885 [Scirpophaga incertulas]